MRKVWGCDGPTDPDKGGFVYEFGDRTLYRCPNSLLRDEWVQHALRLYGAYKQGLTPSGKGTNAETMHYLTAMTMIQSAEAQAEAKAKRPKPKGHHHGR